MSVVAPESSLWDVNWAGRASCRVGSPDDLFAKGAAQQTAKVICQRCPVVAECLADALDNRTEYGVWGGMTERERRALLRRRPDVKSWAQLFKAARADALRDN
ncbi:WhiB family transcriptional regulator [Calidifontibacter indicus]|uniref:Transcriptional regulator WhiB n=1 Tax=Calidifontibacter indicus TaxID=419650 RepID=A0A3D9UYP6_9MICO|nr:WhiB family transcriptional regulator [Calidifontibacter indicus]REF29941.1 transcription factor WhiB [Calidifontibacter indicus]